jgi:hypothetical protein
MNIASRPTQGESRTPTATRTLVIVLAQVVVIVALIVLWSIVRRCRSSECADAKGG